MKKKLFAILCLTLIFTIMIYDVAFADSITYNYDFEGSQMHITISLSGRTGTGLTSYDGSPDFPTKPYSTSVTVYVTGKVLGSPKKESAFYTKANGSSYAAYIAGPAWYDINTYSKGTVSQAMVGSISRTTLNYLR